MRNRDWSRLWRPARKWYVLRFSAEGGRKPYLCFYSRLSWIQVSQSNAPAQMGIMLTELARSDSALFGSRKVETCSTCYVLLVRSRSQCTA